MTDANMLLLSTDTDAITALTQLERTTGGGGWGVGALAERYPKSFVTSSYFWDLTFLSTSKTIKAFYPRMVALRARDMFVTA